MLAVALAGSAFLMGAAGSLHCAAMCAAPCAAVSGASRAGVAAFQMGRLIGYGAGGGAVAMSVGGLLRWEAAAGWLRPLWLALHLAMLAMGLYLMWRAEQPRWFTRWWAARTTIWNRAPAAALSGGGTAWSVPTRSAGAGIAGLAWLAWPCGLLQSALMVAALADGPWQGAAVMAAFGLGSAPGLLAGPWLLGRLGQAGRPVRPGVGEGARGGRGLRWATRLSGALLTAGAAWALGHGLWAQVRAYCG
ncbi:hypothetical protein CDN99_10460 [Roseateles aquatilis]|uniref:Urease accessory protein UreH-like transmembrane domain-containing protein n=1 Tax=Roseateles aquatilis TaxID=431061 RepID=A0A246JG03_9BURK|nr:sulfite exporter TauE/SafE family protein [Roseateles aquatilis]OWQ91555.1 hypothetical protein CDN99_10460 [Roseateles aquatilis]